MKPVALSLAFAATLLASPPSMGAGVAFTLTLADPGEWTHVIYSCAGQNKPMPVDYVNADPNYLALVPIDGKVVIFADVISGSGARYAAGRYQWWTKASDAGLTDLMAPENSPPLLTCHDTNPTP